MSTDERLIAGAMSGTSADGVDVAITQISGRGLQMQARLIRHHHRPYDASLKSKLFQIRETATTTLQNLAEIGRQVSRAYAAAVNETLSIATLVASDLAAIAAHGQTLYHAPPDTIQWLDPALIASEVGCAVVSDFRRADCAAGGQGAPLVPFADYILFRHPTKNRLLLNIGGIANITWLKAGGTIDDVIAFDTGPGNCLSDHLARRVAMPGGIDREGATAMRGSPNFALASLALRQWRRFQQPPPKSTDTPEMIAAFERAVAILRKDHMPVADLLASACQSAALGISAALEHLDGKPDELFASGGGIHNARIVAEIEMVTRMNVIPTDKLDVPSPAKEAIAFALLAGATLDGVASNVPSVTGAKWKAVLGSITARAESRT